VLARREQAQVYFNQVAGRFDRVYGPGRSWQAFGHLLLRILPPLVVADLGAGEGLLSELLARRCKKVIAVDNSEKIVAFGAAKAKKNGLKNLEFRLGDLQNPPIEPNSVDLVILSQALHHAEVPAPRIAQRAQNFEKGGQILILDLLKHNFEKAGVLYGDRWRGFEEGDLHRWLEEAGFKKLKSASWPARNSRRISKPSWPARRNKIAAQKILVTDETRIFRKQSSLDIFPALNSNLVGNRMKILEKFSQPDRAILPSAGLSPATARAPPARTGLSPSTAGIPPARARMSPATARTIPAHAGIPRRSARIVPARAGIAPEPAGASQKSAGMIPARQNPSKSLIFR
jgi:ubiquinone/menaquinone biosynthesis C-methylase UbiE